MPVHACFNTDFFVPHAAPGGGRRFMIEEVEDEEKKEEGVPMIHLACLYDTHSPRCGKVQSIQLHPAIANYFGLWLWIFDLWVTLKSDLDLRSSKYYFYWIP